MAFPTTTALYAGLLGLAYLGLSLWVVAGRASFGVHHGDGNQDGLNRRIRAHGNFGEYVPLILLFVALLESGGSASRTVHLLLAPLVLARLSHPFGMLAPIGSRQQLVFRGGAMIVTWLVLLASALLLLVRAL